MWNTYKRTVIQPIFLRFVLKNIIRSPCLTTFPGVLLAYSLTFFRVAFPDDPPSSSVSLYLDLCFFILFFTICHNIFINVFIDCLSQLEYKLHEDWNLVCFINCHLLGTCHIEALTKYLLNKQVSEFQIFYIYQIGLIT